MHLSSRERKGRSKSLHNMWQQRGGKVTKDREMNSITVYHLNPMKIAVVIAQI